MKKDILDMTSDEIREAHDRKEHIHLDFKNGYSISIIRGIGTYGWDQDLYEIAVMKGGDLDYSTPVTGDVVGYLTGEGVVDYIHKVMEL